MDDRMTGQPEATHVPETTVYEQLYRHLYDYHFGRIKFLELLDKWKEILHLLPSDEPPCHMQQEKS